MFRSSGVGDIGVKVVVDFGGQPGPTKVPEGPRLYSGCMAHQREQGLHKIDQVMEWDSIILGHNKMPKFKGSKNIYKREAFLSCVDTANGTRLLAVILSMPHPTRRSIHTQPNPTQSVHL